MNKKMKQEIIKQTIRFDRLKLLRIVLQFSAVFQMIFWSFSHWFFPKFFFASLGVVNVDFEKGFAISQINMIGAFVFSLAVGTWLAAKDPIKNKVVVQMLFVAGIACAIVFIYNIFMGNLPTKALFNVFAIVLQLVLVGILYPWRNKV